LLFYDAIKVSFAKHLLHVTFTAFPLLSFFISYNFRASFYFPDDFAGKNFLMIRQPSTRRDADVHTYNFLRVCAQNPGKYTQWSLMYEIKKNIYILSFASHI
jgi:hypothetical protein